MAGFNCRYNGSNCINRTILDLVNNGKALPICPEQLGGLTTPRESCEIKVDKFGKKRVIGKDGCDYTQEYTRGAELTLAICIAIGAKEAILKSKSPSCGCGAIYDGTFSGNVTNGYGLTAELLNDNGIHVKSE